MATLQRDISRQEQRLLKSQKELERIEKIREQMVKRVEEDMDALDELRLQAGDLTSFTRTTPPLADSVQETFQSQYDKFDATKSNERLKPIDNKGVIDFNGKLESDQNEVASYKQQDGAQHYDSVDPALDLGKMYYVSGYYYSSGQGTKEYEYQLWPTSGEVKVGDVVQAPVHLAGWHEGRQSNGHSHNRRFVVTGIYTKPQFKRYYDFIK